MEEQPIDKLFKRKLYESEIVPGNKTWSALQAKRGQKRTIPIWSYGAVAASLLIIGLFSWWTLQTTDKSNAIVATTKSLKSRTDLSVPKKEEDRIAVTNPQQEELGYIDTRLLKPADLQTHSAKKEERSRGNESTISNKDNLVIDHQFNSVARVVHINESKLNSIPITTEPTRVPLEAKVLVNELTQPSLERTLIVTIDVPVSSMDTHVKLKEPVAQMTDTVAHKSGFGNLIKKMKRLKEGDVLALSVAETSKTSRKGLGKLYEDVKESIKNNSTE